MRPPKIINPRKQSIFITRHNSTSSSSGFGISPDSPRPRVESHRAEPPRPKRKKPRPHGLEYAMAAGLLPGTGARLAGTGARSPGWARPPGISLSYESEICRDNKGGTSPVASACVAAAMTANIPMAIAFTMRQISDETVERKRARSSSRRTISRADRSKTRNNKKSSPSLSPQTTVIETSADSTVLGSQSDSVSYELPRPSWSSNQSDRSSRKTQCNDCNHYVIPDARINQKGVKRIQNHLDINSVGASPASPGSSDLDNSVSSPLSSSHTSVVSSLSDTSVSSQDPEERHPQEGYSISPVGETITLEPYSSLEDNLKGEKTCHGTYNVNFVKIHLHYSTYCGAREYYNCGWSSQASERKHRTWLKL